MNIFEFIAILTVVFGLTWGLYHAADTGLLGLFWAGIFGAAKGYLAFCAFLLSVLTILAAGLRFRPPFPRCKRGRCKAVDFTYLYLDSAPPDGDKELERIHNSKLVRCRCGDLYLRKNDERKFYEVREDRTLVPFMRYSFCGRWRPDKVLPAGGRESA